jgi:hypothetical protein
VALSRKFTFIEIHETDYGTNRSTGFIGFPAAQALARAGHIVYGQTRSEAKAKQLAAEESKHQPLIVMDIITESKIVQSSQLSAILSNQIPGTP